MRFLTSEQIRTFEGKIITDVSASLRLINNAANACVKELMPFDAICVFCGKGNNGGDGYRLAALLRRRGKAVYIVRVFEPRTQECKILAEKCSEAGIPSYSLDRAGSCTAGCDAVVDAIFGIGINGEVTGEARTAIELINSLNKFVLAVDVPSGLDADSGRPCGVCVRADKTITFTAPKLGMSENASVEYCGDILVREAGIPVDYGTVPREQPSPIIKAEIAPLLPKRPRLSHKGTFGRLLMIVGSEGMLGAGAIAAKAAQRSGCGLVTIVCRRGLEGTINIMVPEAVVLPLEEYSLIKSEPLQKAVASADAILIGCGLGRSVTAEFIESVLDFASVPMIIDADGLNTLAGNTDVLRGKNLVITPHPLEFSRLTGKTVAEIEANRLAEAKRFAAEYGITLTLKGARTVVADRDGDASVSLISTSALARGGSGDVLAGVISSLCAQGISPENSAKLGVYLHGLSGIISARLCGEYSATINDIIDNLKFAFMEVEGYEHIRKGMG